MSDLERRIQRPEALEAIRTLKYRSRALCDHDYDPEAWQANRIYAQDWVHVLAVRDDRITRLREYDDTAAMRAAFDPAFRR